jgi:hypothetical protein
LERHINFEICSICSMFFNSVSTTRLGVFVYFSFNLSWCVCQQNWACRIAWRHLWLLTLKRWEESRIQRCWFLVFKLMRNISCHSKVWVLVYCCWNNTRNICTFAINMWEWVWEAWSCLNRWKSKLSNVIWLIKSKYAFDLIEIDVLLNFDDVRV